MTRRLHPFPGGVHPPEHKTESNAAPIRTMPLLPRYIVPLRQHIGNPALPRVKPGDQVLKGQMIGAAEGRLSTAVHAPTSGRVVAVGDRPTAHISGLRDLCIEIESDGDDRAVDLVPLDWRALPPATLRQGVRDLGLAGLGGAVFPSHVKLEAEPGIPITILILNGAECEPWITCDDRLMRERASEVLQGGEIVRQILGADTYLVGIEDNKPEAIAALRQAQDELHLALEVVVVPTHYPSGGGKQLTQLLTGQETPTGGRSTDIGIQIFNVGTAYAMFRAMVHGEPMIQRVVTVTGHVREPGNVWVRIGTPIADLIDFAGGELPGARGELVGGPMMGFDLRDSAAPVVKGVNCIIAKDPERFPPRPRVMPCIRCGQCARACPIELQPFELYWYARAKEFGKTQAFNLFDCIECGCCSYVCPSHIPLVDYYRFAKAEIWAREKDKSAADLARERHDFREFRLERERREKTEKFAQKAAARLEGGAVTEDDPEAARKKAILQAAIDRAKKAREGVHPQNVDHLPPDKQREIDAIEARRRQAAAAHHAADDAGRNTGKEGDGA